MELETNKILSRYVDRVCVAYDNMEKYFSKNKLILTGNPIRQDILGFLGKEKLGEDFLKEQFMHNELVVIVHICCSSHNGWR